MRRNPYNVERADRLVQLLLHRFRRGITIESIADELQISHTMARELVQEMQQDGKILTIGHRPPRGGQGGRGLAIYDLCSRHKRPEPAPKAEWKPTNIYDLVVVKPIIRTEAKC